MCAPGAQPCITKWFEPQSYFRLQLIVKFWKCCTEKEMFEFGSRGKNERREEDGENEPPNHLHPRPSAASSIGRPVNAAGLAAAIRENDPSLPTLIATSPNLNTRSSLLSPFPATSSPFTERAVYHQKNESRQYLQHCYLDHFPT